jgi:hypothetical protein
MHTSPEWIEDCLSYKLPDEVAKRLLCAVKTQHNKKPDFLNEIESAIQQAMIYKGSLEQFTTRVETLKEIDTLPKLANRLLTALNDLSPSAYVLIMQTNVELHRMNELSKELQTGLMTVGEYVQKELQGAGRDTNDTHNFLCADIGHILRKMGIKLTASRPREGKSGGPFWSVSKICLSEIDIYVEDIRDYLKKAIIRIESGQGGVRFIH